HRVSPMRAVVCHEIGSVDNLSVEDRPVPEPDDGQVRLAVKAAGASFADALMVTGRYQFPQTSPYVPGGEAAGVVDAVGPGVDDWNVGGRAFASVGSGGYAEYLVTGAERLVRLPDTVDLSRGASFLQVYGTAWFALTRRTVVRPGEVMLVTGA